MQCDPVQALYGIRHSEVVFGNSDMDNVSWDRFLVPSNSPTVHCHYLAIPRSLTQLRNATLRGYRYWQNLLQLRCLWLITILHNLLPGFGL